MEALEQKSKMRKGNHSRTFNRGDKVKITAYWNVIKPSDISDISHYVLGVRTIDKDFSMMGKYLSAPKGNNSIGWLAHRIEDGSEVFICERDLVGWKEEFYGESGDPTPDVQYYVVERLNPWDI